MIETDRLRFRKFAIDDLDWLTEVRADEEVALYLGGVQSRDEIAVRLKWYIGCYEKLGFGYCVMQYKESGEEIGWAGLQPLDDTGEIEVGYGIIKKYWGRGIGTEACRGWLDHGFNQLGLMRITAIAVPENIASRHIMEKCGMGYEKNIYARGLDLALHTISREDFDLQKNRHET